MNLFPSPYRRPVNPRFAATVELQRPDVCRCHRCQRPTTVHRFTAPDGHRIETHHCAEHGDVVPARANGS